MPQCPSVITLRALENFPSEDDLNRFWTVSLWVEGRYGSDVMILNRMTDSPTRFAINVEAKES